MNAVLNRAVGAEPAAHVGVVGGGMLGLGLALRLLEQGHRVTVIEGGPAIGGLTRADQFGGVTWDRFYHVTLLSDSHLRALLDDIGLSDRLQWRTTRTGFFTDGRLISMSSALDFLRFPPLSLLSKIRLAWTILFASRITDPMPLEQISAVDWLTRLSGRATVDRIWRPLLRSKLGENYRAASAAFIWAIIARLYAARRAGLHQELFGYVDGGYDVILARLRATVADRGVELACGRAVTAVKSDEASAQVTLTGGDTRRFDAVIMTVPCPRVAALCPQLTVPERERLERVVYQGVICPSLLLRRPLADYYVTNITDSWVPFTGVIEMTALVDPETFGGQSLVYLPRYLTQDDSTWDRTDEALVEESIAALERMYPAFSRQDVVATRVARAREVLAISTLDYSRTALPPLQTSLDRVFVVNSAQIAHGTLNVNETLALAARQSDALAPLLRSAAARRRRRGLSGAPLHGRLAEGGHRTRRRRGSRSPAVGRPELQPEPICERPASMAGMTSSRPMASVSLDVDNLWSYLKTHGDAGWEQRPSYYPTFFPAVLDVLDALGLRITFFVVGCDAAVPAHRPFLQAAVGAGHDIGNHSYEHEPWLHRYTSERLADEIAAADNAIESATGRRPVGFRGPGFSWSPALLEVLVDRGYLYDASTLPSYIGPLARAYYFWTAHLSPAQREERAALFGSAADGFRPARAYRWSLPSGRTLLEIPVTTVPVIKMPFHLSYLLYLSRVSEAAMDAYLRTALTLCRLTGTEPSFLLHPLDLLGADQAPALRFFPGMDLSGARKLAIFRRVMGVLAQHYRLVDMETHARAILAGRTLSLRSAAEGSVPIAAGSPARSASAAAPAAPSGR